MKRNLCLSTRQREVFELMCEGLTNKAIGARLGIDHQTVKVHVTALFRKFGAANRTQVVARALRP